MVILPIKSMRGALRELRDSKKSSKIQQSESYSLGLKTWPTFNKSMLN
jgi:hypothetical protein